LSIVLAQGKLHRQIIPRSAAKIICRDTYRVKERLYGPPPSITQASIIDWSASKAVVAKFRNPSSEKKRVAFPHSANKDSALFGNRPQWGRQVNAIS
jgi:hypothetical protein